MRLVTLHFPSSEEFLAAYHPADGGTLSTKTRTDGNIGEDILVEINFPALPNRVLVRAQVIGIAFEHGLRFAFAPDETTTRDFLLAIARGELSVATAHRGHTRFPSALHASWSVGGGDGHATLVDDLSAGGAFVRATEPPTVGDEVTLALVLPDGETLSATGHVAWIRSGKDPGFGVEFGDLPADTGRRLRSLLRHASERAQVDLES